MGQFNIVAVITTALMERASIITSIMLRLLGVGFGFKLLAQLFVFLVNNRLLIMNSIDKKIKCCIALGSQNLQK
jgi:hypothetical protein